MRTVAARAMDCHVATLLAMTGEWTAAWGSTPEHIPLPQPSLRAKRGNPVRTVAARAMDCHVAALLAMTEEWSAAIEDESPQSFWQRPTFVSHSGIRFCYY